MPFVGSCGLSLTVICSMRTGGGTLLKRKWCGSITLSFADRLSIAEKPSWVSQEHLFGFPCGFQHSRRRPCSAERSVLAMAMFNIRWRCQAAQYRLETILRKTRRKEFLKNWLVVQLWGSHTNKCRPNIGVSGRVNFKSRFLGSSVVGGPRFASVFTRTPVAKLMGGLRRHACDGAQYCLVPFSTA